jgi:hypothetical protein
VRETPRYAKANPGPRARSARMGSHARQSRQRVPRNGRQDRMAQPHLSRRSPWFVTSTTVPIAAGWSESCRSVSHRVIHRSTKSWMGPFNARITPAIFEGFRFRSLSGAYQSPGLKRFRSQLIGIDCWSGAPQAGVISARLKAAPSPCSARGSTSPALRSEKYGNPRSAPRRVRARRRAERAMAASTASRASIAI